MAVIVPSGSPEPMQIPNDGVIRIQQELNRSSNRSNRPSKNIDDYKVTNIVPKEVDFITGTKSKIDAMSPAEMIHHLGPDFMTNKFDAFWLWNPAFAAENMGLGLEYNEKVLPDWMTDIEKTIVNYQGFAVRATDFSIPPLYNDEFETDILETKVMKIRSKKIMDHQSSFSFRLDQDLFWLDQIDAMTGRFQTRNVLIDKKQNFLNRAHEEWFRYNNLTDSPDNNTVNNYRRLFKTIAKTWGTYRIDNPARIKDYGLCLVIKMTHLSNYMNNFSQMPHLPFFVFENVKVLGTSDKIQYTRDAGEVSINVDFIFRRCYQVVPNWSYTPSGESWSHHGQKDNSLKPLKNLDDEDVQSLYTGFQDNKSSSSIDDSPLYNEDIVQEQIGEIV